jgi:hypothetical protein
MEDWKDSVEHDAAFTIILRHGLQKEYQKLYQEMLKEWTPEKMQKERERALRTMAEFKRQEKLKP